MQKCHLENAQKQYFLRGQFIVCRLRICYTLEKYVEDWDFESIEAQVKNIFNTDFVVSKDRWDSLTQEDLVDELTEKVMNLYVEREKEFGEEAFREIERMMLLQVVDHHWMDHIDAMDQLKQGIYIRGYAQKDPVIEYKFEGNQMFEAMTASIQEDVVKIMFNIQKNRVPVRRSEARVMNASHGDEGGNTPKTSKKSDSIGRNDPCPCGSGKKYKKCCGVAE